MATLSKRFVSVLFLFVFGFTVGSGQNPNPSGYHLLKKIEVGGEGGWDYLFADSEAHRLYVSHATKVVIIDTDKDAVIGEIPNTNGVHGIAVAQEFGRGFISDGRDNAVTIFDLKTLKTLDIVKVGKNPDAIMYDPPSKHIFVFNGGSSDTTVLDAATGKVVGTIALGGKPEFAASDGKGNVFVNIEDTSEVVELDPNKLTVKTRWPIAPGEEASGMAIDRKDHRLFIVCSNKKMIVMNTENGKIVSDLPIGDGTDAAGFDPETKMAFSSNGEGTLTVIREDSKDKYAVVENVTTQRGARTMTLDPRTHKIYLSTAQFGPAPAPTAERPRPRPSIVPNSFVILVFGK
ncbi:MAG TPA: cytochrome D1 domain-containing protein [Pyrinomonadaceae bacterium]|jgi:YVTN family beta-propeller protein|nr:cytochrome D1 domain-containing protein [Pyrinomonadaceae bacterium]